MTPEQFRHLALSLPGAVESSHRGRPDFKVGQKTFATLGYPDVAWGMVKLTLKQREAIVVTESETFKPARRAAGAGGEHGSTLVFLETLDWHTAATVVQMA